MPINPNYERCSACRRPMVLVGEDRIWKHWAPQIDADHAALLDLTLDDQRDAFLTGGLIRGRHES